MELSNKIRFSKRTLLDFLEKKHSEEFDRTVIQVCENFDLRQIEIVKKYYDDQSNDNISSKEKKAIEELIEEFDLFISCKHLGFEIDDPEIFIQARNELNQLLRKNLLRLSYIQFINYFNLICYSDVVLLIDINAIPNIDAYFSSSNFTQELSKAFSISDNVIWNIEILHSHQDYINFYELDKNKSFKWNWDYIEILKNKLVWSLLNKCDYLVWTPYCIERYHSYIKFQRVGRFNVYFDEEKYDLIGFNLFYDSNENYVGEDGHNRVEDYFYFDIIRVFNTGCLSSSRLVNWSKEVIEAGINYWDWSELSENSSINWNAETIEYFKNKIDFRALSRNTGVEWNNQIISQFQDYLDFAELSGNPSINWFGEEDLVSKWLNRVVFLPNKIDKAERQRLFYDFIYEYIGDGRYDKGSFCFSSICCNKGLFWTYEIYCKYIDIVDYRLIFLFGKYDDELIFHLEDKLFENFKAKFFYKRFSDWRASYDLTICGWQLILNNHYFKVSKKIAEKYKNTLVKLGFVDGNFAYDGDWIDKNFNLLDLLGYSRKISIALSDLLMNYDNYGTFLLKKNRFLKNKKEMKIAILGWGSLVWNSGNLIIDTEVGWKTNGPFMPIEFSRISKDGRLTLVIDNSKETKEVKTLYAISKFAALEEAILNLAIREGTGRNNIGAFVKDTDECYPLDFGFTKNISSFLKLNPEIDAVIWTNLPSNFSSKTGKEFNVTNAIEYLSGLTGYTRALAEEYIRRAPGSIRTAIRDEIILKFNWKRIWQ